MLIDGATGTLGLGAVILALAMGAAKIFATSRNKALLDKLHQLDPTRIVPIALGSRPTAENEMEATGGYGVDALIEALGPNASVATVLDSFNALRRGCGRSHSTGAVPSHVPAEVLHRLTVAVSGPGRPRRDCLKLCSSRTTRATFT